MSVNFSSFFLCFLKIIRNKTCFSVKSGAKVQNFYDIKSYLEGLIAIPAKIVHDFNKRRSKRAKSQHAMMLDSTRCVSKRRLQSSLIYHDAAIDCS
jgi:hypothetical protein